MKKTTTILTILCIFIFSHFAIAQQNTDGYNRNFKFGVGLNGGLPLNDPYDFNVGADVRVQYNISQAYSLCLTAGYNNLFVKDETNFGYVPVKVGYKTFLFKNEFYVMGEIGGAFSTTKEYDKNSMIFCPSVGYATKYVDISLRYEFLKDFPIIKNDVADNGLAQLMVRLAYGFDL
ncbi:hypothetical protein EV196_110119 [Mariniflexile fucanivorans]|uniref:Outer membrane protein with beta-barrel domain n=1 Tax=Mariniflexile fucanivorans TaxID=264023 RepID=A0A4R1RBP9_9FLAO|nr:hypothetical protein [Mariniflexile fucanivorans]TCL63166.1 hypothetical protein EV196_110119 [Mariniflexile fucanivorans]